MKKLFTFFSAALIAVTPPHHTNNILHHVSLFAVESEGVSFLFGNYSDEGGEICLREHSDCARYTHSRATTAANMCVRAVMMRVVIFSSLCVSFVAPALRCAPSL